MARFRMVRGLALGAVMVFSAVGLGGSAIGGQYTAFAGGVSPMLAGLRDVGSLTFPPTTAQCQQIFGINCYQPPQYQRAYNLQPLFNRGLDGRGRTIVIIDSFGSPTIQQDLTFFDKTFDLPDPPSFTIRQDAGPVPSFDVTNADMRGWATETTLDVEYAHVIAPGANIVLEETPVSETEGLQGFPEINTAANYAIDHGIGDVISQSFGATEQTFASPQQLLGQRGYLKNAARHHVTVLASSGDQGAAGVSSAVTFDIFPFPAVIWPASDPLVTAVGGTEMHLDAQGNRTAPDNVWNDAPVGINAAAGGGVSSIFDKPRFQEDVTTRGDARGIPDISLSAAVDGGAVVYYTFTKPLGGTPWHIVGGTSEACPLLAGVIAIADQLAGHRLGNINERLYGLADEDGAGGIVDVTTGDISYSQVNSDGTTVSISGPAATRGYDLASGLGTVNAARFVPALAHD